MTMIKVKKKEGNNPSFLSELNTYCLNNFRLFGII